MGESEEPGASELAAICARWIKLARRAKGWTQYDLAEHSGIFQGQISHFECAVRYPGVPNLIRLSDALDCSIDVLLGRAPPTFPILSEPEGRARRAPRTKGES